MRITEPTGSRPVHPFQTGRPLMDPAEYLRLPQREREQIRASLRDTATRARRTYAELLAAEAGMAARCRYPNLARLTFTLSTDADGVSATLVGAYTATGRRLWHVDHDDEWPDESTVADRLAAAYQWWADLFDPAPVDTGPPGDRYQLTVPRDPAAHGGQSPRCRSARFSTSPPPTCRRTWQIGSTVSAA